MKFYTYSQNNSGGSFRNDDEVGIGCYVIIQAKNAAAANAKAESIGLYFNGVEDGPDCRCCGDRWYEVDDSDGKPVPMIYDQDVTRLVYRGDKYDLSDSAFIHYAKGAVKAVKFVARSGAV